MSETASLVFAPDGRVVGLYTEVIDLQSLGILRVKRASRIEFDDDKQTWRVKDRKGFPLFTAPSRRECLEWEQQYFDNKIERGLHDRTDKQKKSQKLHSGMRGKDPVAQVHAGRALRV